MNYFFSYLCYKLFYFILRTQESLLIRKPTEDSSSQPVHFQQACSQLVEPMEEYEDTLEEDTLQEIWSSSVNDHTYGGSQIIGKIIFL